MTQLGELGDWSLASRDQSQGKKIWVSRRDTFPALLKVGLARKKIDGISSPDLRKMCTDEGLQVQKTTVKWEPNLVKARAPLPLPSAPSPACSLTSWHEGEAKPQSKQGMSD